MDIVQTFYDNLASDYDKLFADWDATTREQALILDKIFVASIRDYDSLIETKPPYSPSYIHQTENGRRVSFQVWNWNENNYRLTQ